MRLIRDEDLQKLEQVKKRLHAMRMTETGEQNFSWLTESIADVDAVLLSVVELGKSR